MIQAPKDSSSNVIMIIIIIIIFPTYVSIHLGQTKREKSNVLVPSFLPRAPLSPYPSRRKDKAVTLLLHSSPPFCFCISPEPH